MLDLVLGHQTECRLAHGLGAQDLFVDGENLAFDFYLTGALHVKNRSDAFLSTISLNSGLVFMT